MRQTYGFLIGPGECNSPSLTRTGPALFLQGARVCKPDTDVSLPSRSNSLLQDHKTCSGKGQVFTLEKGHINLIDDERLLQVDRFEAMRLDAETWAAEALDGVMRTSFEFSFDGRDFHGTDGRGMQQIFEDAVIDARRTARSRPGLAFEVRRREIELEEFKTMVAMGRGELPNTMVVVSDFPLELQQATIDVGGYNVTRKQTMLRVISRQPDGGFKMQTQSLDLSDRYALESLYWTLGFVPAAGELLGQRINLEVSAEDQETLIDRLTGEYDRNMAARYGGNWYAGRKDTLRRNTHDFVRSQSDLIDAFVTVQARNSQAAETLRYDLAAALDTRFARRLQFDPVQAIATHIGPQNDWVYREMAFAGREARSQGKTYSGCGTSAGPQGESKAGDGSLSTEGSLEDSGYGNKADGKETWKWKKGICRVDACPTRPGKTKVGPCEVCTCCQSLFDKGKDPSREYKLRRAVAKYN